MPLVATAAKEAGGSGSADMLQQVAPTEETLHTCSLPSLTLTFGWLATTASAPRRRCQCRWCPAGAAAATSLHSRAAALPHCERKCGHLGWGTGLHVHQQDASGGRPHLAGAAAGLAPRLAEHEQGVAWGRAVSCRAAAMVWQLPGRGGLCGLRSRWGWASRKLAILHLWSGLAGRIAHEMPPLSGRPRMQGSVPKLLRLL